MFFGALAPAQIVFFVFFLVFGAANLVFHTCSYETQAKWAIERRKFIYLPYLVVLILQMGGLIAFLAALDDMNNFINNAFPVPEVNI